MIRVPGPRLSAEQIESTLALHRERILAACRAVGVVPVEILAFGSAASGELREDSDLDFAVIFRSRSDLAAARRPLLTSPRVDMWPLDLLTYTRDEFNRRAKLGGVCMIIRDDGRRLFP